MIELIIKFRQPHMKEISVDLIIVRMAHPQLKEGMHVKKLKSNIVSRI